MSDPAVCSFITKVLCSRGGRLEYNELPQHVGLSEKQLQQILEDGGPERFLKLKREGSTWVLAVSAVRVCVRQTCEGCNHLHLCKLNLMRRCRSRNLVTNHPCRSCDAHMIHHLKDGEILRNLFSSVDPTGLLSTFDNGTICSFLFKNEGLIVSLVYAC